IGIAGGEHEFAGLFLRIGITAEEAAEVALEAERELVEGDLFPELGGGDEHQQVFLPPLASGCEGRFAEAVNEELKRPRQGTAGLADFGEPVELLVAGDASEFQY